MFEERGVYVIPVETGTSLFTECVLNPPDEPLLIVGSTMGVPEGEMPISNESKEISRVLKSEKYPSLKITESEKTLYSLHPLHKAGWNRPLKISTPV